MSETDREKRSGSGSTPSTPKTKRTLFSSPKSPKVASFAPRDVDLSPAVLAAERNSSSSQRSESEKLPWSSAQTPMKQSSVFGSGLFGQSEAPLPPPPPSIEVFPSGMTNSASSTMEIIDVNSEVTLIKGRVSTQDVFGVSNSDLLPGKYEGGLKLWEGSIDLVRTLHSEIRNGNLTLAGKKVLELGCGHGLPGIFTCIEGASVVHFQDFNAEVLRFLTIPNVKANLSKGTEENLEVFFTNFHINKPSELRFFAGEWSEVGQLLLPELEKCPNSDARKDLCSNGYDVILMAETVYSISSLHSLYQLVKKCLRHPNGVLYLAGKKHYFGVGGGTAQFRLVVDEDGIMRSTLIEQVADGASNVREVWKFSFSDC